MSMRFGLIGTGFWADAYHGAGLAAHPDVDLVGVWGRDERKAAAVAERHGATPERDLDALLERVDAVSIAVPPSVQPALACRAAEAGCHLLLEKPLALTAEEADEVVEAVERAGVASVVFFTLRFTESIAAWLTTTVQAADWEGASLRILKPVLTSENPFTDSAWRKERGALWDIGPHVLSVLAPALGPITDVRAAGGHGDTVQISLGHESGSLSSVLLSLTVPPAVDAFGVELWGPSGISEMPGPPEPLEAYGRAVSALLAAADGAEPHPCDARFAAANVRVLVRAEQSLERWRASGSADRSV